MRSDPGADDTVRVAPPPPAAPQPAPTPSQQLRAAPGLRWPWQWAAAGAAAAALTMGIVGWLVWPRQTPAPPPAAAWQPLPAQQPAPAPLQPAQQSPAPQLPAQQSPAPQQPAQRLPVQQVPTPQLPAQQIPSPQLPAQQIPSQPPQALPAPRTAPAGTAQAPFPLEAADEAQIRAHVATELTRFRFAANPSIIVLDFASLRQQGLMLNRIAALTEKGATPRDRVLNDTELDAAISASGDTIETFYYGHDYGASEMARFFALAAQQGIALNAEEQTLHQLLAQLGWLAQDVHAGLVSVPKVGADAEVTATARNAILRHELSHGEYFSNPAYAAYVHRFWVHDLTPGERDGIRKFLASEEYDPKVEELVENEMQAYLMFTRDPLFFTPSKIGMTPERLADLQVAFHRNMPRGWLRDLLGQTLPAATSPY